MKTRPILFSAPMVRALLGDRKTMTRRLVNPQPDFPDFADRVVWSDEHGFAGLEIQDARGITRGTWGTSCPYGAPGDRLWVRETWQSLQKFDVLPPNKVPVGSDIQYPATWEHWVSKRRPSIHMCQWMSRITLEVIGVRVERLQAITSEDVFAEGTPGAWVQGSTWDGGRYHRNSNYPAHPHLPTYFFRLLWESINGKGSWDANPWVWVVEFRRVKG